jgi:hypothetical protein
MCADLDESRNPIGGAVAVTRLDDYGLTFDVAPVN